jgi:transcription-repair coupling factor (superfamily II helicase)
VKKNIINPVFAISLSFLLLAGCNTSASKGELTQGKSDNNAETTKKNATAIKAKTSELEEREDAENQIIKAQQLIQQNKIKNAQQILEELLNTTKGKVVLIKENNQAEELLNQIKDHENNQTENLTQSPADTKNSSAQASNPNPPSGGFKYKSYENGRFGFTVQYPDAFTVGPQPTNDDGLQFDNGECEIVAYGSFVLDNETIQTDYQQTIIDAKASIAYQKLGSNWFVISYKGVNNIVYEKSIIQDGVSYVLKITYPSSQQAKYGPMVTHIVNTFVPGHGEG